MSGISCPLLCLNAECDLTPAAATYKHSATGLLVLVISVRFPVAAFIFYLYSLPLVDRLYKMSGHGAWTPSLSPFVFVAYKLAVFTFVECLDEDLMCSTLQQHWHNTLRSHAEWCFSTFGVSGSYV